MKLTNIEISNLRGIGKASIALDPSITVLIGRNGVGKSTILDAISLMLESVRSFWRDGNGTGYMQKPRLRSTEMRNDTHASLINLHYEIEDREKGTYPDSIYYHLGRDNIAADNYEEAWSYFNQSRGASGVQPLFVYYRQTRHLDAENQSDDASDRDVLVRNSLAEHMGTLKNLGKWWDRKDADEARQVRDQSSSYRDPELEAVRELIRNMDGFEDILYRSTASPPGLYFKKQSVGLVHISNLSSGERAYITLLADLARRLQMVTPKKPLSACPGIVLIDEIELNLHPAWQSKIVPTLTSVFSNCQFIITTHSPQVISSIASAHVRALQMGDDGVLNTIVPQSTRGRSSDFLLDGIFDADSRLPSVDQLIEEFDDAIDRQDIAAAQTLLDRLQSEIEGSPAELLVWKKRLKKIGGNA